MRKLLGLLQGLVEIVPPAWTIAAEQEGLAAYARGASEQDCPYGDEERSAAWSCGFRRADRLDASVW